MGGVRGGTGKVNTVDLAWAAGFLEGEGSFRDNHKCPTIGAVQVQYEPLEKLQRIFNRGSIKPGKPSNNKWQPFYRWLMCQAAGEMMTLYNFMSQKRRRQIRIALDRWKTAKGRGWNLTPEGRITTHHKFPCK